MEKPFVAVYVSAGSRAQSGTNLFLSEDSSTSSRSTRPTATGITAHPAKTLFAKNVTRTRTHFAAKAITSLIGSEHRCLPIKGKLNTEIQISRRNTCQITRSFI